MPDDRRHFAKSSAPPEAIPAYVERKDGAFVAIGNATRDEILAYADQLEAEGEHYLAAKLGAYAEQLPPGASRE